MKNILFVALYLSIVLANSCKENIDVRDDSKKYKQDFTFKDFESYLEFKEVTLNQSSHGYKFALDSIMEESGEWFKKVIIMDSSRITNITYIDNNFKIISTVNDSLFKYLISINEDLYIKWVNSINNDQNIGPLIDELKENGKLSAVYWLEVDSIENNNRLNFLPYDSLQLPIYSMEIKGEYNDGLNIVDNFRYRSLLWRSAR